MLGPVSSGPGQDSVDVVHLCRLGLADSADLLRPDVLDGVVDLAVNHGQRHLVADGYGDGVVGEWDD